MWTIGHCVDCVDIVYDQTCGHCAELKLLTLEQQKFAPTGCIPREGFALTPRNPWGGPDHSSKARP